MNKKGRKGEREKGRKRLYSPPVVSIRELLFAHLRRYKASFLSFLLSPLLIIAVAVTLGCQPNQEILKSTATPRPTLEQPQDTFERALGEVRSADFTFIYVFRRKDGGKFDSADKKYVKDFSPGETNRFVLTEEERAVIAGSNFPFPPESLEALRLRFAIEDYSKPKTEESNINS